MNYTEKKVVYFDKSGAFNTKNTFRFARERMYGLGVKKVVIASNRGKNAMLALETFKPEEIVVVAPMYGFGKPGTNTFKKEARATLEKAGVPIIHATHVLGGIDRAINRRYGGITHVQLMAQTFKLFGEGFKVCVEIASMAADCGAVGVEDEIIAIGGTNSGADTAIVLIPSNTNSFFDTQFKEIICIPRERALKPQPL